MRVKMINLRRQPGYFPYYKLQQWSARDRAWLDVQKRFPTAQAASEVGSRRFSGPWRIMEVTRKGRRPYQTFEPPQGA